MIRRRRDIDDFESLDENLFDREEAERRRRDRAAALAAGQERMRQEEALEVRMKDAVRHETADANRALLLADYERAGVAPPEGRTLVSLTLLLSLGWRIETMPDGAKVLTAPAHLNSNPIQVQDDVKFGEPR